jgi:Ras-related protein Rab-2A
MINYTYLFKFIIIGDSSVGKSSLLLKFIEKRFKTDHDITIGVEFGVKTIELKDKSLIKLQIWDTAGQEHFKSIIRVYYRGAIGALLVYDISNRDTFDHVISWIKEVKNYSNPNILFILVGNKIDLINRQVSYEEGLAFADKYNMLFIETSAKTSHNIDNSFNTLAQHIYDNIISGTIKIENEHDGIILGIYKPKPLHIYNNYKSCC